MTPPRFVYVILHNEEPYVVYVIESDADTFLSRLPEERQHDYTKAKVYCIDHAEWGLVK